MSYIPKDAVTQSFKSNKGVLTPNQIIELDNENKFTKFGQLELIQTQTYSSGVALVDFTNLGDDFDVHLLTYNDVLSVTNNIRPIQLQFFENGTLETGSVYVYAQQYNYPSSAAELKSTGDTEIELSYEIGNSVPASAVGYCYMYNLRDGAKYSLVTHHTCRGSTSAFTGAIFGSGVLPQTSVVDGFRLKTSDGSNYSSYDFSLYGIRFT